ncbi:MAG TPA: proline--tRNA ligase [Armatimonadota bacterium]|nr:proline--tRNA ligase [Armatimonadota bacterium]
MRYSQLFAPTLREVSAEVEMTSHRLLLRAGFIRQLSAGVYSFLPLGYRVLNKVSNIIRQEMDRAGAQELLLPAMTPQDLWAESGREATMSDVLIGFKDRKGTQYYLGPTHEEVITDLVRRNVKSYRDLPLNLYQIQMKFRDEPRPRGGLVRCREFLMKDAYSFGRNEEELDATYRQMYGTYLTIFNRCGLDITPVEASGGAIGGKETKEFMLLTDAGEDAILICPQCGYAANQEIADYRLVVAESAEAPKARKVVNTPEAHTVQQVCDFLHTNPERLVKTLIYMADGKPVAALIRGDRELNEGRFRVFLGASQLEMATPEQILDATGGPVGFSGPVGLKIPIYGDEELRGMVNFVTGANKKDTHLVDVNWSDVEQEIVWTRLRFAMAGDVCPNCGTKFEERRGMELGHIFKLRYAISEPLNAVFTDEEGNERLIIMGCYGIGVSRILSAVAEVSNDEHGLIWPKTIAPFQVHLIVANAADETQKALADSLNDRLQAAGVEVLYDDRAERAGIKFKDADLIGVPVQVVVGKLAKDGQVEVRDRATKAAEVINADDLLVNVQGRLTA